MNRYPFLLIPYSREMIWGGNTLKTKYNKTADFDKLGESWELTVRDEGKSIIANGEYANQYLCDVIEWEGSFPLLIKFIDSGDKLSVQVHPDDDILDENGTPLGKTEMWYIISAEKDAHIIYGLNDGITKSQFEERVLANDYDSCLKRVDVHSGDCFFIPAGQVHAIGKGILLAEIQQNSDTTYRLYDYGRIGKDGKTRELHIEDALKVTRIYSEDEIKAIQYSEGYSDNCLANCDKFSCFKYRIKDDSPLSISTGNTFSALIFIEGCCELIHNGTTYPAKGGDTYYIPEDMNVEIRGNALFLCAKP